MEKEEIKILRDVLKVVDQASFKNIKAAQMLTITGTLKDLVRIIGKYEKIHSDEAKVLDEKNTIIKEDSNVESE